MGLGWASWLYGATSSRSWVDGYSPAAIQVNFPVIYVHSYRYLL